MENYPENKSSGPVGRFFLTTKNPGKRRKYQPSDNFRIALRMIPIIIVLIMGFALGLKANKSVGGSAERLITRYASTHREELETAIRELITGDYSQAATMAANVRRSNPENAFAYFIIGLADAHRGLTEEAAISFEKATELRPDFELAWYNLGTVDEHRSENMRALTAYRKASELNTDNTRYSDAVARLERIVLGEGGWDWQESQLKQMFLSGIDAINRGSPDDLTNAESVFRQLLVERPYDVASRNMLGLTLTRMGRFGEAETEFIISIEEEPGFSEAWYNLGMLHRAQGRLEEALTDFETAYSASSLESFQGATMREIREIRELLDGEIAVSPENLVPDQVAQQTEVTVNDESDQ